VARSLPIIALVLLAALTAGSAVAATGGAGQFESDPPVGEGPPVGEMPFDRQGMWIWYVSRSEGGSVGQIIARAKRHGIGTVYVKSGDGGDYWSQFNRTLVRRLHAAGIEACAWQFVYGRAPLAEAKVAAAAVRRGADCFAIDAEADYEGRYAAADRYVRALRARIGEGFPVSLAAFPYVDYHPAFPYSVFLGPGGAEYNQPQMYWKTIGTSVRAVFEHTYLYNRIYEAPIYPLGQTYEAPGNGSLRLFRRYSASYGGLAPSWWSWQETAGGEWGALGADVGERPLARYRIEEEHPLLKRGSRGDMVVWAQQHLVAAGESVPMTGIFGKLTQAAVRRFQRDNDLPVVGMVGTETWDALLSYEPVRARWAGTKASRRGARSSRARPATRPLSASLPAKAYEIDPGPRP
jgi:peptidoglycan hydrolase-like protein with peptidoglycan-binding domain